MRQELRAVVSETVSASTIIRASVDAIFAVLAAPRKHAAIELVVA